MLHVTINVNGRPYDITCQQGQEEQIRKLGEYIDEKAKELTSAIGQISENRLLIMVALLLADEVFEERKSEGKAESPLDEAKKDEELADSINKISEKIISLAQKLEQI